MQVRKITGVVAVAVLALGLASTGPRPAAADRSLPPQTQEEAERARDLIEEALGRLIAGLKLMMDSIPQYEAPEVLENGDILIRRKRAESDREVPGQDI